MQNYKESAQARIIKVVVWNTTNLTKLVSFFSEFSVIFYTIYKVQQFALTVGVTFSRKGPWKEMQVRNWVPTAAAGAGSPIPARPAALRTGEGAEEG
jgi:hypothetical protein